VNGWSKIGLGLVAIIYLGLTLMVSQTLHFSRAFDEGYHLEYITFIKQQGRLPVSYEERSQISRADFPPLYQLLVATIAGPVTVEDKPDFKFYWDSFRYQAIDHYSSDVWSLETEDFQWPYQGRFLLWQIGRWLSIGLSLATVFVVFLTLRELPFISQPGLALAGAASLAFIPRYLILGATLNDDNLLALLAALYFLALVKIIKRPQGWGAVVGLALCLGLSLTVKYTLIILPLEIAGLFLFLARRHGFGPAWAWRRIGLVAALTAVAASWWFGWNLWFLQTVASDGWLVGLLRPLMAGGSDQTLNRITNIFSGGQAGLAAMPDNVIAGTFAEWAWRTFISFWAVEAPAAFFGSAFFFAAVGLLLAVVAVGLWRVGRGSARAGSPAQSAPFPLQAWLWLLLLHTGLFFILPLLRFGLTRRLSLAAQGRHILIPAATAIIALLLWGLLAATPARWQRPALAGLVAFFLAWSGLHLWHMQVTAIPPLPLRTSPQAATWLARPGQATFAGLAELASYQVTPQPEQGTLQVELAWRPLRTTSENYLLKLLVVDAAGRVVSHWLGYNGQGRLPTLAWEPGEAIFDRLTLPLPNLPAGAYQVQLQWLGPAGPLEVQAEAATDGHWLSLASINLERPARLALPGQLAGPVAYALWRADGPVEAGRLPAYRYPATIALVTDPAGPPVSLIDPAGHSWLPTASQAGVHTFVIGPRWPSGPYRLALTSSQPEAVSAGPVLTVENWWPREFAPPQISSPLTANFADQIHLLGYKLEQTQVQAGAALPLTLYWQAPPDKAPQADFTQFNHLLDSQGTLRGGYDRYPLEYYRTLLWAPGEVVVDGYAIPVDADAPPGYYYLNVGYYFLAGESLLYLPLVEAGQPSAVNAVSIGPIEVVAP
jgi:hypothetical protein